MILKLFILVTLCFIITHGDSKEDLKKIKDTLSQGGKVKVGEIFIFIIFIVIFFLVATQR